MLGLGHRGRCWPAAVGLAVVAGAVVLVGLVAGAVHRDVVVEVLGDPLSRLVMLLLGLEACVLAWGPVYLRAARRVLRRD